MGHKEDLNKLWKKNKIHAFYAVKRKKGKILEQIMKRLWGQKRALEKSSVKAILGLFIILPYRLF